MRLSALVESIDHVCCRYRLRAFQGSLAEAGHTLTIQRLPDTLWQRLGIGRTLAEMDAVIIQRRLLPSWELRLLRRRVKKLYFDLDDAVWLRDSYAIRGFHSRKRQHRFASMMAMCDGVIAGNSYLAKQAHSLGAGRYTIIPTCVDVNRYQPKKTDTAKDGATLVWVGSSSTLRGMERFRSTLERLGRSLRGIRLKLICDRFLELHHMPIEACPWDESREAEDISAADIGISWIPDDPWSRGKCGLKILQYMAAGLPVVTNPVGVHPEMVIHGSTGYLVETEDEWVEAIWELANNPDLRSRMGQAGRLLVTEKYSIDAGMQYWLDFLQGATTIRASA